MTAIEALECALTLAKDKNPEINAVVHFVEQSARRDVADTSAAAAPG